MKKNLVFKIFLVTLFFSCPELLAQEIVILKGRVIDGDTKAFLSNVQVQSRVSAVVTDNNGFFALSVEQDDSVLATHVGYEDLWMMFPQAANEDLVIELKQSLTMLQGVTINDVPSEEELKDKILTTPVLISREEENARQNLQDARTLYSMGYRPEMNALDNFKEFIKPPSGFTFFSSKGGGITGLIKSIRNPPSSNIPHRKTFYKPLPRLSFFRTHLIAKDTLNSDTLAVKVESDSARTH